MVATSSDRLPHRVRQPFQSPDLSTRQMVWFPIRHCGPRRNSAALEEPHRRVHAQGKAALDAASHKITRLLDALTKVITK